MNFILEGNRAACDSSLFGVQMVWCKVKEWEKIMGREPYINTNEILGELWRENLISSHVKISPLLWLHNKSRLSHQKTIQVKWFGSSLVFI